jgi:hypothetical protein
MNAKKYWFTKYQMFSFFVAFAEMCSECKIDGSILPSIESFQMRLKLPKVNFIFYEYFFKAVVGDGIWKQCFAENKRLGTNVSEAFAHAIIEINYFAWLYDCKNKNPGCTLLRASPMCVQQKFANEQDGIKRMFFVVAGRCAKVLK